MVGGAEEVEDMAATREGWIDGPEEVGGAGAGVYSVVMYSLVTGPVGSAEIVEPG